MSVQTADPEQSDPLSQQGVQQPTNLPEKSDTEWVRPKALENLTPSNLSRVAELMILDSQCGVLVHKRSLQCIPHRKAQQVFMKHMKAVGEKNLNPYFRDEDIDFYYLTKNDIYLVAVHPTPESDVPVSLVLYLDFLQRVYEVLKDCIGAVNEPYITVNRMLVFEVLDEMVTSGYGHVTSYSEIRPYLTFEPIRPKIPQQDDLASRFFGINAGDRLRLQTGPSEPKSKAPNCAYINIVEGLSAVLGPRGEVYSSELWGKLSLISTLSRPSPILIELNPDLVIRNTTGVQGQVAGAVHIENPSFHSCVDASQLAKRKLLRVLPPSDQTRLMVYTLSDSSCIQIPILLLPTLTDIQESRDRNLAVRLINQAENVTTASYIRVKIKVPQWISNVAITKSGENQLCQFHEVEKVIEWEVKRSKGGSEANILFRLITQGERVVKMEEIGPITLTFNITNFSASGLRVTVARMEHAEISLPQESTSPSQCFFGVSTKAASYSVRTDTAPT